MRAIILNSDRRISFQSINKSKANIHNGEYLVKVMYSPINPSDFGFSQNVYGRFPHKKYPIGLGFEGSGIIEESFDKNLIGKKICFVVNYEKEK
jgi:NADPH:quinone reductase-like Zn-dependent oxidoreductase